MKRLAAVCAVLAGLLVALGLAEWATNFDWASGDQNPLFGDQHLLVNDGVIVVISGGALALVAGAAWLAAWRGERGHGR